MGQSGSHGTEPGKLGDLNGVEGGFRDEVLGSRYFQVKPHFPGHSNESCEKGRRGDV